MRLTKEQAKRKYAANRARYAAKGYAPKKSLSSTSSFNRSFTQTAWTQQVKLLGTAVDQLLSYTFKLSDIIDYTQWTSVFDVYRFKNVTMLVQGSNTNTLAGTPQVQPLYSCCDYDDSVTPVSVIAVLNYGSCMVHHPMCNDRRKITPAANKVMWTGGSATAVAPEKNCWIDCNNSGVEHYGFKLALPAGTNGYYHSYLLVFRYVIEFKNNR